MGKIVGSIYPNKKDESIKITDIARTTRDERAARFIGLTWIPTRHNGFGIDGFEALGVRSGLQKCKRFRTAFRVNQTAQLGTIKNFEIVFFKFNDFSV